MNQDEDEQNDRGTCRRNEECLPPNDRAKHGYCQCKLGYIRITDNGKCVLDKPDSTTVSVMTTVAPLTEFQVLTSEDQVISLPASQTDLYARVLLKSTRTELDQSALKNLNLTLSWSLKSSTNKGQLDILHQDELSTHVLVKKLQQGVYKFEVVLRDSQGVSLASNIVKVEVIQDKTTISPLTVKITSPVNVRLPKQIVKLQAEVLPSDRPVKYLWTYAENGSVSPKLEVK